MTVNANGFLYFNPTTSQAGVTPGNYSQSIGSLAGSGTVSLGSATLTTGNDNTSTTFSGAIGGSGRLVRVGTGTWTVSGANTYTGGTKFAAGILDVGSAGALSSSGNLTFAGGTLQYSAANQTDYSARIYNSTGAIPSTPTDSRLPSPLTWTLPTPAVRPTRRR